VKHHLGSPALFREALIRAMVVGTLIIAGTLLTIPTRCALPNVNARHATRR